MKKILISILVFALVFSFAGCGSNTNNLGIKAKNDGVQLGKLLSESNGNTNEVSFNFKSEKEMLGSMEKAAENDKYTLYYSEDTLAVAVVDKKTGKAMLTNPFNAANDSNYSGSVASILDSQVIVTYLEGEVTPIDLYSGQDCVNLGQYKIKIHENGVSFDLSIGEEKGSVYIPKIISPKRYEEICSKLTEDDVETLESYFSFYSTEDFEFSGITEIYPDLKAQDIYCCTIELSEREIKNLGKVFEKAEYGKEEYNADMKEFGVTDKTLSSPNIKLTLNYALTENGVSVNIPAKSISYNKDFPLLKLSLLPYFGAETPSKSSDGYLFIPDGPGAIINMNKDHVAHRTVITGKLYGENASKLPVDEVKELTQQYYLPVFGTVKNNKTALYGIISSGDANAQITARLGKPNGNYYAANSEFIFADYEQYTKTSVVATSWSNKLLYLYDVNGLKDDITVDYYILSGKNTSYSSFASIYSDYLFGDKAKSEASSALHIETLGSALTQKSLLGFDYDSETVLTSYSQNIELLKKLSENGRNSYSLSLKGWEKNGLDASVSNGLNFSSALGGKDGMAALAEYCNKNNIPLSLNNNLSYVKYDRVSDGFNLKNDTTRTLELKYAENSKLSPDTMTYKGSNYVVAAASYAKYITNLNKDGKKYGLEQSIDLGFIGRALNADYKTKKLTNRPQSQKLVVNALEETKNTNFSFDGANAYVLPYASVVNNIVLENSGFAGESAAVPFLQLVLGDKVVCRSDSINLKENTRDLLLSCVEFGTVPSFVVSYGNTSKLKVTDYTEYYAVDFKILEESIKNSYDYVNAAWSAKGDSGIANHTILTQGVTYTEYQNGKGVYVNRTNKVYNANGIKIPAMDYVVKE